MNEPLDAIRIGPHAFWTEGTDVAHIAWRGDVLPEHVLELNRYIALMPGKDTGIFLVQWANDMGTFTPEARKTVTTDPNARCVRELVMIDANFHARVLMGMVNKAMTRFREHEVRMVVVSSEEEAATHVEAVRRRKPRGLNG